MLDQTLGGFDAGPGQAHPDAAFAQPSVPLSTVVGLIAVELGGTPQPEALPRAHCGNTPSQGLEDLDVVDVGR